MAAANAAGLGDTAAAAAGVAADNFMYHALNKNKGNYSSKDARSAWPQCASGAQRDRLTIARTLTLALTHSTLAHAPTHTMRAVAAAVAAGLQAARSGEGGSSGGAAVGGGGGSAATAGGSGGE